MLEKRSLPLIKQIQKLSLLSYTQYRKKKIVDVGSNSSSDRWTFSYPTASSKIEDIAVYAIYLIRSI